MRGVQEKSIAGVLLVPSARCSLASVLVVENQPQSKGGQVPQQFISFETVSRACPVPITSQNRLREFQGTSSEPYVERKSVFS